MEERENVHEMLTIKETANRSGFSYGAISRMCREGKFPCIHVGNRTYINWLKFNDYLNTGDRISTN